MSWLDSLNGWTEFTPEEEAILDQVWAEIRAENQWRCRQVHRVRRRGRHTSGRSSGLRALAIKRLHSRNAWLGDLYRPPRR
jgi:hypothetical protein